MEQLTAAMPQAVTVTNEEREAIERVSTASSQFENYSLNNLKISKSGKVKLLHQIQKRGQKRKNTIFCWLTFHNGQTLWDIQKV